MVSFDTVRDSKKTKQTFKGVYFRYIFLEQERIYQPQFEFYEISISYLQKKNGFQRLIQMFGQETHFYRIFLCLSSG